ncbi:MAG TPA: hypothetical protein VNB06_18925 [Thermoanaerobaculia bacterium]|nr:hypothetical protein [Thermoanaerobaculia bacterium]
MRIDEQVRHCTSFLAVRSEEEDGSRFQPIGTAFFIGEELGRGRAIKYAVTARHVIDASRPYGALWMRCVSQGSDRRKLFEFSADDWWLHPTADVAVAPLAIPLEEFDLRFLPLSLFATPDWLQELDVGIGDHVVASGLFIRFIGSERDEPLVRFGRVSLMPKEALNLGGDDSFASMKFRAIFAELGSWGGQSGSPVFVYFSVDRGLFAGSELQLTIPTPRLLGLIHGHYTVPQKLAGAPATLGVHVPLNSGIAIIVPASEILEVLAQEVATAHRVKFVTVLREEGLID